MYIVAPAAAAPVEPREYGPIIARKRDSIITKNGISTKRRLRASHENMMRQKSTALKGTHTVGIIYELGQTDTKNVVSVRGSTITTGIVKTVE